MFGKLRFLTSYLTPHYDVTNATSRIDDVIKRNIFDNSFTMVNFKHKQGEIFYGAVFDKLESLPYRTLFWVTENTRPVSKMEYTHAPEKKGSKSFFLRISFIQFKKKRFYIFHSVQEKKDFSYMTTKWWW